MIPQLMKVLILYIRIRQILNFLFNVFMFLILQIEQCLFHTIYQVLKMHQSIRIYISKFRRNSWNGNGEKSLYVRRCITTMQGYSVFRQVELHLSFFYRINQQCLLVILMIQFFCCRKSIVLMIQMIFYRRMGLEVFTRYILKQLFPTSYCLLSFIKVVLLSTFTSGSNGRSM